MANQYSGSLEHKVKERFDCSAEVLLQKFAQEGLTYSEAEKKVGVSHGTVRKWARRFGIELQPNEPEALAQDMILESFAAPEMNVVNFLSRRWNMAS